MVAWKRARMMRIQLATGLGTARDERPAGSERARSAVKERAPR